MYEDEIGIGVLKAFHRRRSTMRRAIVDNPEDPPRIAISLWFHDLLDQPAKRLNAGGAFTAAKHLGLPHVPSGQVSQSAAAFILEFHAHGGFGLGRQGGM